MTGYARRQDRKCMEPMSSDHDIDRADDPDRGDERARESATGETQGESQTWGIEILRSDLSSRARSEPPEPEQQDTEIPQTRIRRSAKLGTAIGGQATRYAGTAAANVVRSEEKAQERLETRHLETALRMASVLGEMKGAAMKIGQMASFIDVDFLPPEYREIYQDQLAKLRTHAPAM